MFNKITETDERGQVGIGTLIVFIAMVLVAAIAAGVLINTAGLLQSQAESTGEESTDQVANNLQIQTVTGDGTSSNDLDPVDVTVSLAPGSDPVNVSDATLIATGSDTGTTNEKLNENLLGDNERLSEGGDTVEIKLTDTLTSGDFAEGSSVEIELRTADGSSTTKVVTAPDIIENGKSYTL